MLVLNQPEWGTFWFEEGESVFVDEHDLKAIDAKVTDFRVVFVDDVEGRQVMQNEFSGGFAEEILIVVYGDELVGGSHERG